MATILPPSGRAPSRIRKMFDLGWDKVETTHRRVWKWVAWVGLMLGLAFAANVTGFGPYDGRVTAGVLWAFAGFPSLFVTTMPEILALTGLAGVVNRFQVGKAYTVYWDVAKRIQQLLLLHFLPLVALRFDLAPGAFPIVILFAWFVWANEVTQTLRIKWSFKTVAYGAIIAAFFYLFFPFSASGYFNRNGVAKVMMEPILDRKVEEVWIDERLSPEECTAGSPCYSPYLGKNPDLAAGENDWRMVPVTFEVAKANTLQQISLAMIKGWFQATSPAAKTDTPSGLPICKASLNNLSVGSVESCHLPKGQSTTWTITTGCPFSGAWSDLVTSGSESNTVWVATASKEAVDFVLEITEVGAKRRKIGGGIWTCA